jgi:hypothetical protein
MRLIETTAVMRGGGIKENNGWHEFKYDIWCIWYIIRTLVNATMYLQHNNKITKTTIKNKKYIALRI